MQNPRTLLSIFSPLNCKVSQIVGLPADDRALDRTNDPVICDGSYGDVPDGPFAFAAGLVDVPHPVHRLAYAAAGPVERRHAHVSRSLLPLAVCSGSRGERPKEALERCSPAVAGS
jgi:hypothetical protein